MGRAALLLAMALCVSVPLERAVGGDASPTRQKSTHDARFFKELLTGRVWVYQKVVAEALSIRDYASGAYFHADGRMAVCTSTAEGGVDHSGGWRVVPSDRFVSLFNYLAPGTEPDPAHVRDHGPIFYDPASGQLHTESWVSEDTWNVFLRGWVQESWPVALQAVCPDVRPPAVVPVNDKQRSALFEALLREDPEAPLRRFAGSERRVPGAVGLAASGHQPTLPAEVLGKWFARNDGFVVTSGVSRYAVSLGPRGDELWLLDGDTDDIVDTIELVGSADGEGLVWQFTKAPVRRVYRLGYPLGLVSTGERYGAMALMDWLVERGEPVGLPFMDRENVGFRFLRNGNLRTGTYVGGDIGGEWWWSKGMLHLRVDGIEAVNTFEWRALAHHVGWSG